jgi:hypothetical protein
MERGMMLEGQAADFYGLEMGTELQKAGFFTDAQKRFGASPDRLIGDDGLLEIKCLMPAGHVAQLISGKVDAKYMPQVQGQLMVTGRAWCDLLFYHPEMPSMIHYIERDEDYIEGLRLGLYEFCGKLSAAVTRIKRKGEKR